MDNLFLSQDDWTPILETQTERFNRETEIQLGLRPPWELPNELEALSFWQACQLDHLQDRLAIPFFHLRTPQKREQCLDIGCGVSFFLYPWSQWDASFFGHELSPQVVKLLQSRAPQLNSKLFKSIRQGTAHQLSAYEDRQFDQVIATGFLAYYPLEYLAAIWPQIRRVLKPGAPMIIDWVRAESPWAEEWGLIELFKGTEPFLIPTDQWEATIRHLGGEILKLASGELYTTALIQP